MFTITFDSSFSHFYQRNGNKRREQTLVRNKIMNQLKRKTIINQNRVTVFLPISTVENGFYSGVTYSWLTFEFHLISKVEMYKITVSAQIYNCEMCLN